MQSNSLPQRLPHVINAVMFAIQGLTAALGPGLCSSTSCKGYFILPGKYGKYTGEYIIGFTFTHKRVLSRSIQACDVPCSRKTTTNTGQNDTNAQRF
ncbi:unnamed protein product [Chondrus crispus]|uniref:Uncharacterized protein n=1 Tax=Chondrus crispus TaxID=2769 RepID=R7Q9A0_CHOCR|nr:unnamed protein product [Chondrus crispus]XP_005718451.1 unnamed protein product [Chondrus crispus]CDF33961.1 unnamed protein product [Chondrus crispus]CDF38558.1 unnamed protein product [Chondrus crispus]|eukprot:XP_005713780.1 unnamed protein product [Chondrus crispus]